MTRPLDKAIRRAEHRDKKRQTRMAVTGKNVVALSQLIARPKPGKQRKK
jgi:hypothetical protein